MGLCRSQEEGALRPEPSGADSHPAEAAVGTVTGGPIHTSWNEGGAFPNAAGGLSTQSNGAPITISLPVLLLHNPRAATSQPAAALKLPDRKGRRWRLPAWNSNLAPYHGYGAIMRNSSHRSPGLQTQ